MPQVCNCLHGSCWSAKLGNAVNLVLFNPLLVGTKHLKIMSAHMAGTKGLIRNFCMAVCYD